MVGTITPMVDGRQRKLAAAAIHVVGATAGGAFLGVALGFAGWLLLWRIDIHLPAVLWTVGLVSLVYGFHEIGVLEAPYPEWGRQVSQVVSRTYSPYASAALYGTSLGLAVSTHIQVATFYIVAAYAFLSQSPLNGTLILGLFGLARGLPILLLEVGGALRSPQQLEKVSGRLGGATRVSHWVNGVVLLASSGLLLSQVWVR